MKSVDTKLNGTDAIQKKNEMICTCEVENDWKLGWHWEKIGKK